MPIAPEDVPPPPYDRVDPEPEMTAQLAREVGRRGDLGEVPSYTSRAGTPQPDTIDRDP